MPFTRQAVAVLCAATLVACDRAADTIIGPVPSHDLLPVEIEFLPGVPVLDPFAVAQADGQGVVESAKGGGHFHVGTEWRTFAFNAKNLADGTTNGQYQLRRPPLREHGTVTCLEVDGNAAYVGAIITHSNFGTEGLTRFWRVLDDSEGSDSPPDQISLAASLGLPPGDQACHSRPQLPLNNVESGNIQVRDAH